MRSKKTHRFMLATLALLCLAPVGCQVYEGGQTLPSAWYYKDDVQYHPAGPEFRLSREAAELQRRRDEAKLEAATVTPEGF